MMQRLCRVSGASRLLVGSVQPIRGCAPASSCRVRPNSAVSGFFRHFSAAPPPPPDEFVPVTFVSEIGDRFIVDARIGDTLLETARKYDVPIVGDCEGGGLGALVYSEGPMCITCHVYIDTDHLAAAGTPSADEENLQYWIDRRTRNSRLACEVIVNREMRGSTIVIPKAQISRVEEL